MRTQHLTVHSDMQPVQKRLGWANHATRINQDSGNFEYYTPPFIVEAARTVLGSIDLDPASCPQANQTVQADRFYTIDDNGLDQHWYGNVWMNHPFGRNRNAKWINKLRTEYEIGDVDSACCITFASTSESWFQPLFDYPLCFLHPRTNLSPDGTPKRGVTKGSVVAYMGNNISGFFKTFMSLGRIMLPAGLRLAEARGWQGRVTVNERSP